MATDSTKVRRWSGSGLALVDFTGSATLPTDGSTNPGPDFDDVGYLGEDGITIAENADTQNIFAWQNGDNVRTLQTSHDVTFAFSMLEWNDISLKVFYPNYSGGEFTIRGDQPSRMRWVFDAFDEGNHLRLVLPSAQVTEKGDVQLLHTAGSLFPVTLTAYPDAQGNKAYGYLTAIASS